MPLVLTIDARRVTTELERAAVRVRQGGQRIMKDAFRNAGVEYLRFIGKRFDRYSAGGGDWAPLSPSTIAQKKGTRKLYETGGLRRSLDPGGRHNLLLPSHRGCKAGTRHPLAFVHQNGSREKHIPARPFVVPPDRPTQERMSRAVDAGVKKLLAAAVGR
jgi:hypothetical protein